MSLSLFAALFAVVAIRLYDLQVTQHEKLTNRGDRQRRMVETVDAERGGIFDGNGNPLAVSKATWDVFADPDWMNDKLTATVHIARILEIDRSQLRRHFESGKNGRCLAKSLTSEQAEEIADLDLAGVSLKRVYRRSYPAGNIAPHVIGFVMTEGHGGAGIEQEFEHVLAGEPGHQVIRADARRRPSLPVGITIKEARPGANVQITIDFEIQKETEAALMEAVIKHQPKSACAIVIDPNSGHILAMASWPTFDVMNFGKAHSDSFRNNVLAFVYESGSTMKPLIAGAAVADNLATWQERIFCENGRWTYRVGRARRTITDHSLKHGGHQYLSITEGIAKSDNILMAKLGLRLGPERLYHWVRNYGFGAPTGIQLPGENIGILLPKKRWNRIGSCMSVPMGHEMAVTPLQMAMAHAAVANGGMWMPPRIVRRVWTNDPISGEEHDLPFASLPSERRLMNAQVADKIEEAMRAVMTEGTGRRLQVEGYSTAGKTGTTEKLVKIGGKLRYSNKNHIGSFVGWGPAAQDLTPRVLALVVIDDPTKNGKYGSQTAGPVVQRILTFAFKHLGIPVDEEQRRQPVLVRVTR